jgi:hypothetical protein
VTVSVETQMQFSSGVRYTEENNTCNNNKNKNNTFAIYSFVAEGSNTCI